MSQEVEQEPPQPLEFEDVVDDGSDIDLPDAPADMEALASDCANGAQPVQSGVGFRCPFEQCRPSGVCWLSVDGVVKHLLQVHVRAGQHPPPEYLSAIGRWECMKCETLHCLRSQCPRAHEPEAAPALPPDASRTPLSAKAVLAEINCYDSCIHHVPHGCEELMAGFTTSLLEKAANSGLLSDIRALHLAPRVVLTHLRRGGKKHESQVRAQLRERIAQWPTLPQPPEPVPKTRSRKTQSAPNGALDPRTEQQVEQAIRDKALGKACMMLTSDTSPITVDIPSEMKKLHPEGARFELDFIPGQLNFSSTSVEAKLKEFPPGSSGGPSGWRSSHLKEMLKAKCKQPFLAALAAYCTRIANGAFSSECMAVITAARLVPIGKPSGGLRPIAVGDVLRRLAGKLLMDVIMAKTTEYLQPEQVGVQVPNAAETAARKIRLWAEDAKPDEVLLQVDMCNAFGTVDRQEMLAEVKNHCPCLFPYAAAFCRNANILLGDGYSLDSTRGVQQGDVLGPALFAIALQPVIERLRDGGLELNIWYLDDGLLVGNVNAVKAALTLLKEHLPWRGLELNLSKCRLIGPGAAQPDPVFDGIPRSSLDEGMVVLGVPVGNPDFMERFVNDVVTKLTNMAARIELLKNNVAKFLLLRACFGVCRINHLLRSLPLRHGQSLAEKASVIVRKALESILGSPTPDLCFLLACLPVRKGGMGLQDPMLVLGPAFLSSNFGFASSQSELPERFWRELSAAWTTILEKLRLNPSTLAAIEGAQSLEPDDIDPAWTKQKWWQEQAHTQKDAHFKLSAPDRLRALQALNAAHRATDITSLVGAEHGPISLASRPWTLLARHRLGLPLDALESRFCPGCGVAMDAFGDHVFSCHKLGIYARHNEVRNELAGVCADLNLQVELEKGPDGSSLRPGDVLVHGLADVPLAVDVGVVHTLQSSILPADVNPGQHAKKMEQRKIVERQALCHRSGWSFTPFVMETIGRWGGKAEHLLQKLVTQWANLHGCSKREAALLCRSRLQLALVRGLARQLERGFPLPQPQPAHAAFEDVYSF